VNALRCVCYGTCDSDQCQRCRCKYLPTLQFSLASDGGIEVDGQMHTSVADVYAAGDVCTAAWPCSPYWLQVTKIISNVLYIGSFSGVMLVFICPGSYRISVFSISMPEVVIGDQTLL